MAIIVNELLFDERNREKLMAHGVSEIEVQEVFEGDPEFFTNEGADRRASHVMLGPTLAGRHLLVPIEELDEGTWRPVTGFEPRPQQAARYRSER